MASRAAERRTTGLPRTRTAERYPGAAGQSTRSLWRGSVSTSPERRSPCSPWRWHCLGGPIWLITGLAAVSVWAAFQSVSSTVVTPDRWSRLLTEGDATRAVLVVTLAVTAHNTDRLSGAGDLPWEVAVACGLLLMAISVERRIRTAWTNALLGQNLPGEIREISDLIPRGLLPILDAAGDHHRLSADLGRRSAGDLAEPGRSGLPGRCRGHRSSGSAAERDRAG